MSLDSRNHAAGMIAGGPTLGAPMLEDLHERLAGAVLENLDWSEFIDRYDWSGTLFYLDPPYFGSEDDYGKALFGRDQFADMAKRLKRLKGRFILSINDVTEIREAFAGFAFHEAELTYSVGGGKGTAARVDHNLRCVTAASNRLPPSSSLSML